MRPALLLLVLLAFSAAPARAEWATVIVTNTEQLSVSPVQVRFTFSLQVPIGGGTIFNLKFTPTDGSHILSCSAPPGWTCSNPFWNAQTEAAAIASGTTGGPFQVVSDVANPCYLATTETVVLDILGGPVCLPDGGPLPTEALTWGKVKSIYR